MEGGDRPSSLRVLVFCGGVKVSFAFFDFLVGVVVFLAVVFSVITYSLYFLILSYFRFLVN